MLDKIGFLLNVMIENDYYSEPEFKLNRIDEIGDSYVTFRASIGDFEGIGLSPELAVEDLLKDVKFYIETINEEMEKMINEL